MTIDYIQIAFTALVSISTFVYALLTIIMVRETIRLREAQTEPEIVIFLQSIEAFPSGFEIIVRNIGGGVAYNIQWEFDHNAPLIKVKETRLDIQSFFTKGVKHFAPGQIYSSLFGKGPELLRNPAPPLPMKVYFENRRGKKYFREYTIDPMFVYGRSWLGGSGIHEISDNIKDIRNEFLHIASDFSRMNINTYNSNDRMKESRERRRFLSDATAPKKKK
jgi:hypothetical protein